MINRTILVGRLTKSPEVRKTNSGTSVCAFTLAVPRIKKEEADFISCVAWNQTADLMGSYLTKGSQIGIEGRISTRNYDDPNTGKKVYVTEVNVDSLTFLESKNESTPTANKSEEKQFDIANDELPF